MVGNSKDSKIFAYKDMFNQLNKTIVVLIELIRSFTQDTGNRPSGKRKYL